MVCLRLPPMGGAVAAAAAALGAVTHVLPDVLPFAPPLKRATAHGADAGWPVGAAGLHRAFCRSGRSSGRIAPSTGHTCRQMPQSMQVSKSIQ